MRKQTNTDVRDADILAFLDQDLDVAAKMAEMMAADPALAARAAALQKEEEVLQSALFRVSCPDTMDLSEYAAGLLPAGFRQDIQSHLAACPYCVQEVAQLKTYLAAVRPDLETNIFKRARVLVARLISSAAGPGSFGRQPAFGVRGDAAGPLMYAADGVQLSLDVQDDPQQPGQKRILGLVIGVEPAGWQAQLWSAGQLVGRAEIDELGNFTLAPPAAATYELIIHGGEVSVHIPELTVA